MNWIAFSRAALEARPSRFCKMVYTRKCRRSEKSATRGKVQIAGFHDDNRHVAVFGRGSDLPTADYFQDNFSTGFAYDGGFRQQLGNARPHFAKKLDDDVELTGVLFLRAAVWRHWLMGTICFVMCFAMPSGTLSRRGNLGEGASPGHESPGGI